MDSHTALTSDNLTQEVQDMLNPWLESCIDVSFTLSDPLSHVCPVVGLSAGFRKLSQHSPEDILGRNVRIMMDGVPAVAVSHSAQKDTDDFCRACCMEGLSSIGEIFTTQPRARGDGSVFMSMAVLGRVVVRGRPLVLSVYELLCDGLVAPRLAPSRQEALRTRCRDAILSLKAQLADLSHGADADTLCMKPPSHAGFVFYGDQLQDHAILSDLGLTATRREKEELPTGCLVMGDRPLTHSRHGLRFALRVNTVSSHFVGLPMLGFTRRRPENTPDLYPSLSKGLGQSVVIGGRGEGFARDKPNHFQIGFKIPPQDEIQEWSVEPDVPRHLRKSPATLQAGDVLECRYTQAGRIEYWLNMSLLFGFDISRPVDESVDYYAVVDVCSQAGSLTLLPPTTLPTFGEVSTCVSEGCSESESECTEVNDQSLCKLEEDGEVQSTGAPKGCKDASRPRDSLDHPCSFRSLVAGFVVVLPALAFAVLLHK
eukprot:TRINITY_DN50441_c0_g1_i1.p1 TRINITY_DN50441_c0_g1~~TRINITY_DN50441_c0_g1_i1.p1  ORF type:complete len:484 (+),score=58.87 TRINITY_DN50441_c0_g1_i1:37-1488(+)